MDLSLLPAPALLLIFQHSSLQERLCSFALVCRSWALAALEATASSIEHHSIADLGKLQQWLSKHGRNVVKLNIQSKSGAKLSVLPCWRKLECLRLRHCNLHLGAGRQLTRDLAAAARLTQLCLDGGSTNGWAHWVQAIACLHNLQHLQLQMRNRGADMRVLPDLQQLPQLTRLELFVGVGTPHEPLQHLSGLSKLKHLQLEQLWEEEALQGLQHLPSLTSLQLPELYCHLNSLSTTALGQLSALQNLLLSGARYNNFVCLRPGLLAGMTQLRQLCLRMCDTQDGGAELLSALQQMQLLTHLGLTHVMGLKGQPAAAYASLTSSSLLQRLELCALDLRPVDHMPAWRQVFGAKNQLSQLTHLQIHSVIPGVADSDLQQVVSCCTALQELNLDTDNIRTLQLPQLGLLQQLPGLTQLHATPVDDAAVASTLVLLTGLRELHISGGMTDVALQELTALQRLTTLSIMSYHAVSPELQQELAPYARHESNSLFMMGLHWVIQSQVRRGADALIMRM